MKIGNFDLYVKYLIEIKLEIDTHASINQIRIIVRTTLNRKLTNVYGDFGFFGTTLPSWKI